MGVGLPLVGYIAATSDGANEGSQPNQNKRAEVDTFVGLARIAFLDGWGGGLLPSGVDFSSLGSALEIPEKNFQHRIFFDTDLEKRPQLFKALNFLKSDPIGGCLCVISIDDIKVPTGPEMDNANNQMQGQQSRRLRSLAQCYAIRELENIPIIECGRRNDPTSLVHKFARIPMQHTGSKAKSDAVARLIDGAIRANAAQLKRLETAADSCVLARLKGKNDIDRSDFVEDSSLDLACRECASWLQGPLRAVRK